MQVRKRNPEIPMRPWFLRLSRSTACVSEFEGPQRIQFSMSDERVLQMAGRYTIIKDLFLSLNCILQNVESSSNAVTPTILDSHAGLS
jgi:hypothetical protein